MSLTVTDGGGLTNTITHAVTVTPPAKDGLPVASFTSSCTNLACTFNSTGSTDDVGIVSRAWTFGDGTSAGNVVSPSATYVSGGTYTVSLTVTDGGGLTNTITHAVTVAPLNLPPVASFTSSCTNLACTFNSTGSTDDVGIVSRAWTFGDGTSAGNVVSPAATYASGGTYTVSLTVTDGGGLTNTVSHVVTVAPLNLPPVASFTSSCTNLACTFNSTGSTDDVGIVSRAWTFGDGTSAGNVVSPSANYATGGTYTVSLTVTDGGGLTNTITHAVTVTPPNQPPVASFTSNCTNLACTFNSTGSTDDVGIVSRAWTFGDGTSAGNVVSPSATYISGGTYTVSLTVTDGGGLTNTVSHVVTVAPLNLPPVASFTSICTNLACTFNSTGSTDDVGIVSRAWTFGDGTSAGNVVSPSATYASGGTYTVSLTVTDGGGLTNTITHAVTVTPPNQPPVASFTSN